MFEKGRMGVWLGHRKVREEGDDGKETRGRGRGEGKDQKVQTK